MPELLFEVENVFYSYLGKFPALSGVSLSIAAGEKISIIGANGSGKSTLLQILDGLIFPDQGAVKFLGTELKEKVLNQEEFSRDFRKKIGLVFQNPDVQLFCPTVKEDIVFGPLQLGAGKDEIRRRLEEICEILDIGKCCSWMSPPPGLTL
ncbi:MAG: ABC transporter ATP-binding protein [Candidatus Omnitrophica bacterium]|nr:ABC transporter ATP-binding protein [Candidatus Omnitrophota bacterium]